LRLLFFMLPAHLVSSASGSLAVADHVKTYFSEHWPRD